MPIDLNAITEHDMSDECPVCRAQDLVDAVLLPAAAAPWELRSELPYMEQYDWDDWLDFMEDNHDARPPHEIELPGGPDNDSKRVNLPNATLDELSTAVVALDKEIERMTSIKVALGEVQKRARNRVRPGSMTVHEALLGHAPDNE